MPLNVLLELLDMAGADGKERLSCHGSFLKPLQVIWRSAVQFHNGLIAPMLMKFRTNLAKLTLVNADVVAQDDNVGALNIDLTSLAEPTAKLIMRVCRCQRRAGWVS